MTERVILRGKIVSLIQHNGRLILATEFALYEVSPDGKAAEIELVEPPAPLTPESRPD